MKGTGSQYLRNTSLPCEILKGNYKIPTEIAERAEIISVVSVISAGHKTKTIMNKARRKQLEDLIEQLSGIKDSIEAVMEEEQEAFDNLPEGIQASERGETMQENIDNLQTAADSLESEVIDYIQGVIDA